MKNHFFHYTIAFMVIMISACQPDKKGCTDHKASNYDVDATIDNGSCLYEDTVVYGCTNPLADNYNSSANVDDGSCIISGCMDPTAENYNPNANNDDGSCIDQRKKYAGTYAVTGDCALMATSPTISYDTSSSSDTVIISPFLALGGDFYAIVNDTLITVPAQSAGLGPVDGSGNMVTSPDTVITILYNYDFGFLGTGSCTATYTKQ